MCSVSIANGRSNLSSSLVKLFSSFSERGLNTGASYTDVSSLDEEDES